MHFYLSRLLKLLRAIHLHICSDIIYRYFYFTFTLTKHLLLNYVINSSPLIKGLQNILLSNTKQMEWVHYSALYNFVFVFSSKTLNKVIKISAHTVKWQRSTIILVGINLLYHQNCLDYSTNSCEWKQTVFYFFKKIFESKIFKVFFKKINNLCWKSLTLLY